MKKITTALFLTLAVSTVAFADHSVEHPEPPVVTTPEHHETPAITPPVYQPPPTVTPLVTSPVMQSPATFQLPAAASPTTILPTDVSGFHVNSINQQAPIDKAVLMAKDARFQFTGQWLPFDIKVSGAVPTKSPYRLVSFVEDNTKQGHIEHVETSSNDAAFMPTVNASFERVDDRHLRLIEGAVIVRGAIQPIMVSTKLCDENVVAQIGGNALTLISAFDGRPTILNLVGSSANAVSLYVPIGPTQSHLLNLKPGQIAEAYKLDNTPTSNLVAKKIIINQRIGPHCGLLVSQCHYVRAMRKFNLVASLPSDQYQRVLKTAASLEHMRR
ncbi:MAG: hypothetical protein K2Y22_02240 [Candidatus Obscuribacterales bacterium]|nr:hypothetical protein [Candidatus Obscuribacterales bacterium]